MSYEVVVVGGGIGGLTAAALLAARGLNVCLIERGANVGGCLASFAESGYEFESGAGIYAGWGTDGIHRRIFDELKVAPPEARRIEPGYVVRLADRTDVRLVSGDAEHAEEMRRAFPECAAEAVRFFRDAAFVADALLDAAREMPGLAAAARRQRMGLIARRLRAAPKVMSALARTTGLHLEGTSARFREFIDAQLRLFTLTPAQSCAYLHAAIVLTEPQRGLHALLGGGQALADALADSIRRSGGTVRLNTTALRLAFDAAGRAAGVQLLDGEQVTATRAVVSNLTLWDTYGKLVGHARTPSGVRERLKALRGQGAYQIFVAVEEDAARRLTCERVLAAAEPDGDADGDAWPFMFSAAPSWDARAPAGKRAATFSTFTDAERWFVFDSGEGGHEEADQRMLEDCWRRLHAALPELGAGAEVLETETPLTLYERTRRRMGMTCGIGQSPDVFGPHAPTHRTTVPRLFMVGDTVFPGNGVAAVAYSALAAANEIAPRR